MFSYYRYIGEFFGCFLQKEWGEIEEKGEVVKAWQPKKPREPKKKPPPRRSKGRIKGKN